MQTTPPRALCCIYALSIVQIKPSPHSSTSYLRPSYLGRQFSSKTNGYIEWLTSRAYMTHITSPASRLLPPHYVQEMFVPCSQNRSLHLGTHLAWFFLWIWLRVIIDRPNKLWALAWRRAFVYMHDDLHMQLHRNTRAPGPRLTRGSVGPHLFSRSGLKHVTVAFCYIESNKHSKRAPPERKSIYFTHWNLSFIITKLWFITVTIPRWNRSTQVNLIGFPPSGCNQLG